MEETSDMKLEPDEISKVMDNQNVDWIIFLKSLARQYPKIAMASVMFTEKFNTLRL